MGYPKHYITLEYPIIDHNQHVYRYVDIVCFYKDDKESLHPLILIECKDTYAKKDFYQLFGYNKITQAPIICLASRNKIHAIYQKKIHNTIPTYQNAIIVMQKYLSHTIT